MITKFGGRSSAGGGDVHDAENTKAAQASRDIPTAYTGSDISGRDKRSPIRQRPAIHAPILSRIRNPNGNLVILVRSPGSRTVRTATVVGCYVTWALIDSSNWGARRQQNSTAAAFFPIRSATRIEGWNSPCLGRPWSFLSGAQLDRSRTQGPTTSAGSQRQRNSCGTGRTKQTRWQQLSCLEKGSDETTIEESGRKEGHRGPLLRS